ncbi:MAG TPA: damage-inducible protein DinB [Gammaproteobacteria bacterium]|nr:damage-inducible protein DinB [Gammaproteobacteria bacterium]
MTRTRKSLFVVQSRYNRWMNHKLYGVCEQVPDEQRKQDMGAFFRSIHGTLNHLLLGDRLWMGRFTGADYPVRSLDQELYDDFAALWRARTETDTAIASWIDSLGEDDLDRVISVRAIVTRKTHRFRLADALLHFFHHQTHHRGQVTTLLSQLGYDFGTTDMMWMPGIEIVDEQGP